MQLHWIVGTVLLIGVVLVGVSTVLVADSPYDENVQAALDKTPPDRPARWNATSAVRYVRSYEEQRLAIGLLATRGYVLDVNDEVNADCTSLSVSEQKPGQFRIQLRCAGGIDDTKRLFEPGNSSYRVTYRVTENQTEQLAMQGYPFSERGNLRTHTPQS